MFEKNMLFLDVIFDIRWSRTGFPVFAQSEISGDDRQWASIFIAGEAGTRANRAHASAHASET